MNIYFCIFNIKNSCCLFLYSVIFFVCDSNVFAIKFCVFLSCVCSSGFMVVYYFNLICFIQIRLDYNIITITYIYFN